MSKNGGGGFLCIYSMTDFLGQNYVFFHIYVIFNDLEKNK